MSSSKFQSIKPVEKRRVDPEAVESFGSQAKTAILNSDQDTLSKKQEEVAKKVNFADRTKSYLLRLTPEQFDRFEEIYKKSSFKSKQNMGEELFMSALDDFAKKIGPI